METLVRAICQKEGLSAGTIQALNGGQVNQVYQVDRTYVVRVGGRADAFERLKEESDLLRALAGQIPVPRVLAFGQQDGFVYQIQAFLLGQKLISTWKDLTAPEQESVVAGLAAALKVTHARGAARFGALRQSGQRYDAWGEYLAAKFARTLAELKELNIRMLPGFVELAQDYFDEHSGVLAGGTPCLVHSDLTLVNLLSEGGRLSAILDFEYALQAPPDYELWAMEAFCLYPNDWAEEGQENYCSADFASFLPLLRKHYPALFEVPHLRERLNLYQLDACLGSYLAWRKDNLSQIPPERMAARNFYMAKITNFIFQNGARMI